jgi:hypothetical protein
LFIVLGCLASLFGQMGTFTGTVADPSGASVPKAAVTALNADTGQKFRTVTSMAGDFTLAQVPPGTYEVDVAAQGFKTLSRKGLKLDVDGKVTLSLALEVGSESVTVSVTGEAPLLRTADAQIGEVINSLMIENLPQLDRNPLDLLKLTGNIAGTGTPGGFQSDIRINGGREQGLDVLVDGNSVLLGKGHNIGAGGTPTMEQVDEFKVITNGIPAEYGRVSGGLITLVTKGGTNEFHGQGFEYFQNQLFDANSWEQNWQSPYVAGQKAARAQFHNNEYGGRIGGPVVLPKIYNGKNRTFFFFNFDQSKSRSAGNTRLGMAATAAEKNGDLSGLVADGMGPMMYDPNGNESYEQTANGGAGAWVRTTPMPGNGTLVPAAQIDGVAKLVNGYMPLPNHTATPGWSQENAYLGYQSGFGNNTQWETRIDHSITDNNRLTFRFNRQNGSSGQSQWYDPLDPANATTTPGALQSSLGWTWTASPTTIVEVRGSVAYSPSINGYKWPSGEGNWPIDPTLMALTSGMPGAIDYRVWSSNANGWGDNPGAQGQYQYASQDSTSYDFTANVTKIWNHHTIKTGFDARRMYDNNIQDMYGPLSYQGIGTTISNDNTWDTTLNHSPDGRGYADSWGDWMLGTPVDANQAGPINLMSAQGYFAGYVQDDYKVNNKLTLNLGLRWDMETPMTDRYNHVYGWDPNATSPWTIPAGYSWTGALASAGLTPAQISSVPTPSWVTAGRLPNGAPCYVETPACPDRSPFKYHPGQFAPRLAGAYQLDSKTVLRASWGMMYLTATGDLWNSWIVDAGQASTPYPPPRTNGTYGNITSTNAHLFTPSEVIPFNNSTAALDQTVGGFYEGAGTDINYHPAMEQNWNFTIQRELPGTLLVELAYNGNHSGDLPVNGNPQSPFPGQYLQAQYAKLFQTQVANPLGTQTIANNSFDGATVPLGILMLANPAFGGLSVQGQNIGRSNYNAATIKLQKRMSHGLTFLFSYTYSKALDDVGNISSGPGGIDKPYQSFQTISDLYGYSPNDMTHRISFYHDYQLPFGKGRQFLGAPSGWGGKLLDRVVGGWEYAGQFTYHSGTPLSFSALQDNISIASGVSALFPSISGNIGQISPSNFNGNNNNLLTSSQMDVGNGYTSLGSAQVRRFDVTRFSDPQAMTAGNIPNVYPWIRNPGRNAYDASLMKNFGIARDGKIFFQLRVEAQNVLNIRGLGNYNTQWDSPSFGLITASGQDPRQMKISGRIFF